MAEHQIAVGSGSFHLSRRHALMLLSTCSELRRALAAWAKAVSVRDLYAALLQGVHVIRPGSEIHFTQNSFFCIEKGADSTKLHFIVSRCYERQTVTIYCSKSEHPYTNVVKPTVSLKFEGRLTYTNGLTGNVVSTAFSLDQAWWLHGLPRNIEAGYEDAV
jgi:hypothetical protein